MSSLIVTAHLMYYLLVVANGRVTATAAAYDKQYEDTPTPKRFGTQLGQAGDRDIHTSDADNTTVCPTWFYPKTLMNGSTVCECGRWT